MKRLTGFINGFIACLLMVYSFIIFVLYRWARNEDICGFEIRQRYSTNRPKYKYPVKYSYVPSTLEDSPIENRSYIHHIDPITPEDILSRNRKVFDLDNLILKSSRKEQANEYRY